MGLPKSMTPALIRRLNEQCDIFRDTSPHVHRCFDCIVIGWCDDVWQAVSGSDAKIVGKLENGGKADG